MMYKFTVSKKICILLWVVLSSINAFSQVKINMNSDQPGIKWKLKAQDEIGKDSVKIYSPHYDDAEWVSAVVPGSVFTAYVNAGIEKDPNWADNIYKVDHSKYNKNFWYRATFERNIVKGETLWLNFEGINRKGEVFLNGIRLGLLDGFMHRGKLDVTPLVKDGKNVLAVLVHWPGKPIANHASPTYISSDGWDWMPSVPGLLQGITDDVFLTVTGAVTFNDTWVRTELPSKGHADISLNVELKNSSSEEQQGIITGTIHPGNIEFSQPVILKPGQAWSKTFNAKEFRQLAIEDPLLWWPNGYGQPNLYDLELRYSVNGKISDVKKVRFGIKKYSYDTTDGVFHLSINGARIFAKGGNWGMSEYLLRCRGEEYDLKVKLHRDMNYNIIRNWIGSVTDEEFYDACDKYGIMVWDDFWLNSHPNLPDDVMAFNHNAVEKIKRLRNHPSIAVWCGDNEGYPLPPLNGWLRENIKAFDADDRWYQPNSHSDGLTGSGPWTNNHPGWYFTKYPGGFGGDPGWGFRTEIGTAVFTTFESFKKFMPDSSYWPRNQMWDKHFFGPSAANGGPDRYFKTIASSYGQPSGIEDFCRKAQLLNIETNKALYEGWQHHMWKDASGVMTWMSQSAYPSFVWQTYDYYYDLNGAYWGVKKACEPLHIQWGYADNSIKISNTTLDAYNSLKATAIVFNLDGSIASRYRKQAIVNVQANNITDCFSLDFSSENKLHAVGATVSSVSKDAMNEVAITDNNIGTRWSSDYNDNEWVYVDLGQVKEIGSVVLNWESAYAKSFSIHASNDAGTWKEIYSTSKGNGGMELIEFKPVMARYIKMLGIKRATQWGYSLFEFEVFAPSKKSSDLTAVHFIRLNLEDKDGKLLSENFYWRSGRSADYTALNKLPAAKLITSSKIINKDGRSIIQATIKNVGKTIAFAIHVQALRSSDGERILPALMSDNYFSLMKGESKQVEINFDPELLKGSNYKLLVEAYNK